MLKQEGTVEEFPGDESSDKVELTGNVLSVILLSDVKARNLPNTSAGVGDRIGEVEIETCTAPCIMRPENWAVFSVPKFFHFAGESKNQPFFINNHVASHATADDFVEPSTTATAPDYTQKERTTICLIY